MQGHESWGVPQLSPRGALRGWALRHLEAGLGYRQGRTHPCGAARCSTVWGAEGGFRKGHLRPPVQAS